MGGPMSQASPVRRVPDADRTVRPACGESRPIRGPRHRVDINAMSQALEEDRTGDGPDQQVAGGGPRNPWEGGCPGDIPPIGGAADAVEDLPSRGIPDQYDRVART